ncbi:MAG: recombinase family protein [Nitrospirales bacterium]
MPHSRRHSVLSRYKFQHLGIAFISFQENIDTGSPLGKAVFTIISAMAELDRNIIVERIRGGLQSKKRWLNLREEQLAVGFPHDDMHNRATQQRFQEEKRRFGVLDEEGQFDTLLTELKQLVAISPRVSSDSC